jgi:hypothetical protein
LTPCPRAAPRRLEVGNLANATEDRSHFAAWVVTSSPLILSFNLSDGARMDRTWPFISNRALLDVNQRWVGSPGRRLALEGSWQVWAKPLGQQSYAVLLLGTGTNRATVSLPLRNVSADFANATAVCVRDLYAGKELPPLASGAALTATLPVHDSAFYCVRPLLADRSIHRHLESCEVELRGCPYGP